MSPTSSPFQTSLPTRTLPSGTHYTTRLAALTDIPHLTALFFDSFHPTHPFFRFVFPHDEGMKHFWNETFEKAIQDPHGAVFVVEERDVEEGNGASATSDGTGKEGKGSIVALAWWDRPSQDWEAFEWPELPESVPMDVAGPFFGGMDENREVLMKGTAHWCLELLAISNAHQGRGLGAMLVSWGASEADRDHLPMFLHATEAGTKLYKRLGFEMAKDISVPERKEFGRYVYQSYVRPAR